MHPLRLVFGWLFAGVVAATAQTYTFTPLAGTSSYGSTDGVVSEARFGFPQDVVVDGEGNVFVADTRNHTIRKIASTGLVTTVAGAAGQRGSADGIGTAARFSDPRGIALDRVGTLYVADGNLTIRKILVDGMVTTLAGAANQWGSADGVGSAARFGMSSDVAVDGFGNVYVADAGNGTIRKVSPAGEVTTLAGTARGLGVFTDVGTVDGIGSAARFSNPLQLTVDSVGNVLVADYGPNGAIRKITPAGVVTSLKTNLLPWAIAIDHAGNMYATSSTPWDYDIIGVIYRITPSGVVTELAGADFQSGAEDGIGRAARFASPGGLSVDVNGNVIVADTSNNTVRKITPDGVVTTLAGLGPRSVDGTGGGGRFQRPTGLTVDRAGNVYVIDNGGAIRKVTPEGVVSTLAGSLGNRGAADGVGSAARFDFLTDVAVDDAGNIFAADGNRTVRKITPQGVVTTLAGTAWQTGSVDANGGAAQFSFPFSVAVDQFGNVYVADNNAIRRIRPNGDVTTVAGVVGQRGTVDGSGGAARFGDSLDLAVDGQGNVFASDYINSTIRKITPDGVVRTIAGAAGRIGRVIDGPAESARFYYPKNMAVDSAGSVFVVDSNNSVIRKISNGIVTTVKTSLPTIDWEAQLAVDAAGNLYVPDTLRQTILKGVLIPAADSDTRLTNLSVRASLRAQQPLVAGFNLRGSKPLLLRGVGPGLQPFIPSVGLAGDPRLDVYGPSGTLVASNDNWSGGSELIDAFAAAGAFPLSIGSTDAALLRTVSGQSTAHFVTPANGVGLFELFDLDAGRTAGFANLSARYRIGSSGDTALVSGFTIEGSAEKTVLIRGIGPGLAASPFNITDALADPTLTIFNRAGQAFANNDDSPSILADVFERVGAFPLAAGSKDAALMLTLQPGVYSAALSGADGGSGEAMIEIYEVR